MTNPSKPSQPRSRPGWLVLLGVGIVAVLCCAGPGLLTSGLAVGALAAIGVWASNPWVITAAIALTFVTAGVLLRRRLTNRPGPDEHNCSPPDKDARGPDDTDRC